MKDPRNSNLKSSQSYLDDMLDMTKDEFDVLSGESAVAEFYADRNVLVTGASGFMGILLIEKLLRSCPKLGKIYMLIRAKKGKTPEERLKEQFNNEIYERLKSEQPDFLSHVVPIEGDTSKIDLGLSAEDRETLIENTHVVFHGAALVSFDAALREVININVRGTKLLIQLARRMKNLKTFVYISTAFSHCRLHHIEEKFYATPIDPEKMITLVELMNDEMLAHMQPKVLGKWPNCYTLSKALGEEIIRQYSTGLPVCIVRPSMIISTYKEPIRSWINNMYGPIGAMGGAFIGLVHVMHSDPNTTTDMIPANYPVNNVIVAGWDTAINWAKGQRQKSRTEASTDIISNSNDKESKEEVEIPIYNSVTGCRNPLKSLEYKRYLEHVMHDARTTRVFWHYSLRNTPNKTLYNVLSLLMHVLPAVIVDITLLLCQRDPMLLETYRKIHKFIAVTSFFCLHQWEFDDKNVVALWDRTSPVDRYEFDFNVTNLSWDEMLFYTIKGFRVYMLRDPMETLPAGRAKTKKLQIAHYAIVTTVSVLLAWIAFYLLRFCLSLI